MSSKIKEFEGIFFQTGRLINEFIEEEVPIGSGGFGIVTRAKHTIDDKDYAIKKIRIKNRDDLDKTIRERKMWAKLDCDLFVQYRSSWVELSDNRVINQFKSQQQFNTGSESMRTSKGTNPQRYAVLHIQMDLCAFSLNEALEHLTKYFQIGKRQLLPPMAYCISSELLLEILDCIKYLHEMTPQILHRDINPNNILIKKGWNGKFVKISDFGGAVEHIQDQSHTRMYGTMKYMAPEVMNSRKYDSSADVYSIAVMTQQMFNFDINANVRMEAKYNTLREITARAMAGQAKDRPNCKQWLDARNEWTLNCEAVRDVIREQINVNKEYDIHKEFVPLFLKTKYNIMTSLIARSSSYS